MSATATKSAFKNERQGLNSAETKNCGVTAIQNSWSKIAPFWPLKNLIAVNPLAGFEYMPFEEALRQGQAYFQPKELPEPLLCINRESIKWLQAFFDDGQSTIELPLRHQGLFKCILTLLRFDKRVGLNVRPKLAWLDKLIKNPETAIAECLLYLEIPAHSHEQFLTLMLTTLPGWAAHVSYSSQRATAQDAHYPVTREDYLALRLVLTCLLWPKASDLLTWYQDTLNRADVKGICHKIAAAEASYRDNLLPKLKAQHVSQEHERPKAQLVFCIDVRSEPLRRALERLSGYETYGYAGFFGVPVTIENAITGEAHASCPALVKPVHKVVETPTSSLEPCHAGHQRLQGIKKLYQSVKYTFTTPFSLVETIGMGSGLWMMLKTFFPKASALLKAQIRDCIAPPYAVSPEIQSIPDHQKAAYALAALKMMGLTSNFATLIVFCGHGSRTQNNAYATALDCGACGGHHGASNARILADILNTPKVRDALVEHGIEIPDGTYFLAAEHNTTTDEVEIFEYDLPDTIGTEVSTLKIHLAAARSQNNLWRCSEMDMPLPIEQAGKEADLRAHDWAQVRPEWGLARNAAFIVGPRSLTKNICLEGRSFLHSYDWREDPDSAYLTTILTAPMVVAQWINAQYLFSTLDNVAFGGGSKVTQNITGKIGIMQGNASDLMHGLPLQSVYKTDLEPYHQPLRLTVIVYAPSTHIDPVIKRQAILQKLFRNGWVHLVCQEPGNNRQLILQRDLTWSEAQ